MEASAVKTILLVEDNPVDVFINTRVIEQSGLRANIISQSSAREALDYLAAAQENLIPDLILLDIRMPEMDGFEFMEAYENLPEVVRSRSRVILLSSSIDPVDYERAKKHPAILAFIPKPFTKEKLAGLFATQ